MEGRNTKNNRFVLATLSHRDSVLKESPCIEQDYVEPNFKKQRVCVGCHAQPIPTGGARISSDPCDPQLAEEEVASLTWVHHHAKGSSLRTPDLLPLLSIHR